MNSQQQQQEEQKKKMEEQLQKAMMDHLQGYPIHLESPPSIASVDGSKLRTKDEFFHSKLSCVVVDDDKKKKEECLKTTSERLEGVIHELEETGCYDQIQFRLGANQDWQMLVKEKPWYKVYVGGGIKGDPLKDGDLQTTKLQAETSIGLRNLTGHCDMTNFTYAVDQTSTPNLQFTHDTPLPPYLPALHNIHLQLRASTDTLDHTYTRSCRERQSQLQLSLTHHHQHEWTWTTALRDVMPRRHTSAPYKCDASHDILKEAGPSLKHSLRYSFLNHLHAELAGPPGDVGFFKLWGSTSHDLLQWNSITFHAAIQAGFLHPLSFAGLCPNNNNNQLSDRFFVGGPNQLRGFLPSGIGPRSKTGGSSVPGGDALGGNVYYASTLAASMPFYSNFRCFSFVNFGSLTNSYSKIVQQSRISIGAGISTTLPAPKSPRLEATYAIPLRYGPSDARRRVQAGIGFSIG